mgnify:FL=1
MKKQTFGRKALALLLAALCLSSLYGCGGEKAGGETDTAPVAEWTDTETEAVETEPSRPKPSSDGQKFNGESFRVLYRFGGNAYNCKDVIAPDGLTGEVVNDAVYHRNIALEEMLDIKLDAKADGDPRGFVTADVQSGSGDFDVVLEVMNGLAPLAVSNYLYNWRDMPYFDENMPWWDKNSAAEMSLANRVYLMAGDISMKTSGCVRFFCFNKDMWEDYGLEEPYAFVEAGKWTVDRMAENVRKVSLDLNGDGKMDGTDRWGLLNESPTFLLVGCGVLYTTKDENDLPVVSFVNEHAVGAMEKVKSLLDDKNHVLDYFVMAKGMDTSAFPHIYDYGRSRFAAGQLLMIDICADDIRQFADMDERYGILPNPKLDDAQSDYYHLIDPFAPVWALSSIQKQPELTGAAMEAWGYLSGDLVEAFYETTMKKKRADAPEDAAMLDMVRASVRYELGTILDFGIASVIDNAYKSGNLISSYEKQSGVIGKKIAGALKNFVES